ncbi:MAG: 16S rRNA (cytidine(1402)-2'-O)-methyltransferase [Firmicutes bacterium]|nr:16S rRNA (cytidine(1402)-2'-O)-methyltransferase [Bacillota bacterium]
MSKGCLYLCPTPLGNLEDITLRVLRILREADKIAAEDTRRTRKLLSHYDIHTQLVSYHEHNKINKTAVIIDWLSAGQKIALVSDAGMPAIADPGEDLVRAAIDNGIQVVALPGPVAAITALAASGLDVSSFVFYGFIPPRGAQRKAILAKIMTEEKTVIIYEAPHRLCRTLRDLKEIDPLRQAVVARELTKVHEEYIRGSLEEVLQHFLLSEPKGECTVLVAGLELKQPPAATIDLQALIDEFLAKGYSTKQAAQEIAQQTGVPRNEIYRLILTKK